MLLCKDVVIACNLASHHCHWQTCSQDDVPSFPDDIAFAIIEEQLGRPLEELFSSISERPVAAASLGQVGGLPLEVLGIAVGGLGWGTLGKKRR